MIINSCFGTVIKAGALRSSSCGLQFLRHATSNSLGSYEDGIQMFWFNL